MSDILQFTVADLQSDQNIKVTEKLKMASDTLNQVDCEFTFTGTAWSDFDSIYAYFDNTSPDYILGAKSAKLVNGECTVPWEVLTECGNVKVNLKGYDLNQAGKEIERLTTYSISCILVKQKVNVTGSNSVDPTPATWQQELASHTGNTTVHTSAAEKLTWNAKLSDAPSDSKTYGRKNGAWTEVTGGGGSVAWNDITGKPSTFPPSSHNQSSHTITA